VSSVQYNTFLNSRQTSAFRKALYASKEFPNFILFFNFNWHHILKRTAHYRTEITSRFEGAVIWKCKHLVSTRDRRKCLCGEDKTLDSCDVSDRFSDTLLTVSFLPNCSLLLVLYATAVIRNRDDVALVCFIIREIQHLQKKMRLGLRDLFKMFNVSCAFDKWNWKGLA